MSDENLVDRMGRWVRTSVTLKLVVVGFLILILLIPAGMIKSLIYEREGRRNAAVQEMSATWGGPQVLGGPILTVPYKKQWKNKQGRLMTSTHYAHFLPEKLDIKGNVQTETRYRGIYEAVLYGSTFKFTGQFASPSFDDWGIEPSEIQWDAAFITIGIPDMRGIKNALVLQWGKKSLSINPGPLGDKVFASGVHAKVPLSSEDKKKTYPFSFELQLNGSKRLNFIPVGKVTTVSLKGPWTDPSFKGSFLPEQRSVNENGFDVQWRVLHLNRNFPQRWRGKAHDANASQFGVDFLIPVDQYRNTHRSIKYAVLFIFLTFLVFFFIEFMRKKRLHPLQYILVGSALVLFYLLLLSLSEHMPFLWAYGIASVAVMGLITGYTHGVMEEKSITLTVTALVGLLYSFLYCLLQLQDYSLVIGSTGLFLALAAVMYLTRKMNWYGVEGR